MRGVGWEEADYKYAGKSCSKNMFKGKVWDMQVKSIILK